jgi:hypothetical protein
MKIIWPKSQISDIQIKPMILAKNRNPNLNKQMLPNLIVLFCAAQNRKQLGI